MLWPLSQTVLMMGHKNVFYGEIWLLIPKLSLLPLLIWSTEFLSTPIGVDYVEIGFDMEEQPLVTHNAAWPLCMSAICIDVMSNQLLFAHMPWALLA